MSYALAERFAIKCFTPLELTHFKDNFFTRATDDSGLKYWNEACLSEFLGIPDGSRTDPSGSVLHESPLDAGPVIFRMVSYLGAFPFQHTLAPSLLTFDSMVKVVVLLTERYGKVLRRGRKDRIKLLFGSLADVGRRNFPTTTARQSADGNASNAQSGFAVDQPAGGYDAEEEEEDDDDEGDSQPKQPPAVPKIPERFVNGKK